jgi:LysM repeat protein
MYNISVSDLKAINTIENNDIKIDQRLIIVPVKNSIIAENKPQIDNSDPYYYKVEKGETLFAISRKFNVPVAILRQLNNGSLNQIKVGEKIRIR